MEDEYDHIFKLVVIGDSGVGKSKIIWRYINDEFYVSSHTTIGVELATKIVEVEGYRVKAQVWDTAGQEKYRALTSNYYRGAVGVMLVYDITNRTTFVNLVNWLAEAMRYHQNGVTLMLVGNKIDVAQREVSFAEGEEFAKKYNLEFIETSALSRMNVEVAFNVLLRKALESQGPDGRSRKASELRSHMGKKNKTKCC
mmetsp:Transcript_14139/g.26588  ORF Transcript_14139/g.26588 Transcript_14139/m.26588 type:complete len:198 (+) Transcript_14139:3422-4015(+)